MSKAHLAKAETGHGINYKQGIPMIRPLSACLVALALLLGSSSRFATADDPLIVRLDQRPTAAAPQADPVVIWNTSRSEPRPRSAWFMRFDLQNTRLEPVVMVGEDPDGDGPAEATLTMPTDLMNRYSALAGINANAFAKVRPVDRFRPWTVGMHVDVIGMAVSDGALRSPLDNPRYSSSRVAFWLDHQSNPTISRPPQSMTVQQAVGDFGAILLQDGEIIPEDGGPRHPRSAIGFDETNRYLMLAVVDGRRSGYSDGVTMRELASLLLCEGCEHAINLDGGGSSIMMFRQNAQDELLTVNRPSDNAHRPIPTMIGIRRRPE